MHLFGIVGLHWSAHKRTECPTVTVYHHHDNVIEFRAAVVILALGGAFGLYHLGGPLYWRFYATVIHPFDGSVEVLPPSSKPSIGGSTGKNRVRGAGSSADGGNEFDILLDNPAPPVPMASDGGRGGGGNSSGGGAAETGVELKGAQPVANSGGKETGTGTGTGAALHALHPAQFACCTGYPRLVI
jgi:hypothetical protein